MTETEKAIARSNETARIWKAKLTAALPTFNRFAIGKLAGAIGRMWIDTDEQLAGYTDEQLLKVPGFGEQAIKLRNIYIAKVQQGQKQEEMPVFDHSPAPAVDIEAGDLDWGVVIKSLRDHARRDMNQASDLLSTHRDVPNAIIKSLLMQSNAQLLSRLADSFAQGVGA